MPTYQYACTACGERLEAVQSFTDAALTECPACAGALRKVFSAVGVVFKGSGFYKTDSRAKSTSDAGSSSSGDATSDSKGSSSDGAKTDGGKTDGGSKKESAPAAAPAASTSSTPAAKTA